MGRVHLDASIFLYQERKSGALEDGQYRLWWQSLKTGDRWHWRVAHGEWAGVLFRRVYRSFSTHNVAFEKLSGWDEYTALKEKQIDRRRFETSAKIDLSDDDGWIDEATVEIEGARFHEKYWTERGI